MIVHSGQQQWQQKKGKPTGEWRGLQYRRRRSKVTVVFRRTTIFAPSSSLSGPYGFFFYLSHFTWLASEHGTFRDDYDYWWRMCNLKYSLVLISKTRISTCYCRAMDGFTQARQQKTVGQGKLRGKAREITCSLSVADSRSIIINNNDYSFPLDLWTWDGPEESNCGQDAMRRESTWDRPTTTMAGHLFHRSYLLTFLRS